MKVHTIFILIIATALGSGSAYRFLKRKPPPPSEVPRVQPRTDEVKPEKSAVRRDVPKAPDPDPKPVEKKIVPPVKAAAPPVKQRPQAPPMNREAALRRYWEIQAQQFDRQIERLNREEDSAKRMALIRSMSRYVRINTLSAIEWAMGIADPEERRAALEAINKNSLSGIGARIEIDETGFPKIGETTVLSAIAATGQVEPGDYIVGMEDGNGQPIYFEGLSARQVAQYLRGQPGTEVRVLMERVPNEGSPSQPFDVTVQRSLLVVQPPF